MDDEFTPEEIAEIEKLSAEFDAALAAAGSIEQMVANGDIIELKVV